MDHKQIGRAVKNIYIKYLHLDEEQIVEHKRIAKKAGISFSTYLRDLYDMVRKYEDNGLLVYNEA